MNYFVVSNIYKGTKLMSNDTIIKVNDQPLLDKIINSNSKIQLPNETINKLQ